MIIKVLFILLILIVISGVVLSAAYMRLRPYIQTVRKFLKSFKELGEMDIVEGKDPLQATRNINEKLVRCTSCGLWIPESRAVKLKSNIVYCSHTCLENAAQPVKQKRRSSL